MSDTTTHTPPAGVSLVAGAPVDGDGPDLVPSGPCGLAGEAPSAAADLPTYRSVSLDQLEDAVAAAAACRDGDIDPDRWAAALDGAADRLEAQTDRIVTTADAESGLGRGRLEGELARTTGQLRMMAAEARSPRRRDVVVDPPGDGAAAPGLHRTTVPVGVVGVFAASNFPLAFGVAGTDVAAAWGAGCPVVAKAHPSQPATAELCGRALAEAADAAGLHPGAYAVLHEQGHDVGQALVRHPDVDAVAFTGSQAGGRALFDLAAARPRPIPVYAEMGSLNPLVVSPGAAADRSAELVEGIAGSYLLGEGQFCTKPGLVVLPDDPAGTAVEEGLVGSLGPRQAGHPLLNSRIAETFAAGLAAVAGLEGVRAVRADDGSAAVVLASPDALLAHRELRDELFGPSTVVVRVPADRLEEVLDALDPALTATLHFTPTEAAWARRLADRLARRVGRVIANGYPTGVRVSPAQHHGGPYPATTSPLHTSVGLAAIDRFRRPVAFQSFDPEVLPSWAGG